ncbi:EAL domain-containing protein (plasmid) [Acuticoccus sp. MNP-M23]|uniref:putative bifunctional diguanylate cyclase/phosphodiesterase n=1 Tax=Acuticoccus sp. MNP-M23 TaxID=3072793 RepID=UPI0028153716|nr:EAL domain-containing protein [Acuticoccus sp. MNP-M23]WMS45321.1 EAL domain-containing protein [Acuticoccus sp. MNP-M23]
MIGAFSTGPIVFTALEGHSKASYLEWLILIFPLVGAVAAGWIITTLRQRLKTVQEAMDATGSSIVVYDKWDRLVLGNEAYRMTLGVQREDFHPGARYVDLVEVSLKQILPSEAIGAELARRVELLRLADGVPSDRQYPNKRWLRVVKNRTKGGANVGVAIDVTENYELREKAEAEARRFLALAQCAPVGICQVGKAGNILFVNDTLLEMFDAINIDELRGGQEPSIAIAGEEVADFTNLLQRLQADAAESDVQVKVEAETRHFIVRKALVPVRNLPMKMLSHDIGNWENILIFVDVTRHKEHEARIKYLAHRDVLTGAHNRLTFNDDLVIAANEAGPCRPTSLIAIDLDRFKPVNDIYGHVVGDELLCQVAERMTSLLPSGAKLYRVGGDEFAVLLTPAAAVNAVDLARMILHAVCEPFEVEGRGMLIGASLGISTLPNDTEHPNTLVHYADLALYHVKNTGGGNVMAFNHTVLSSVDERRELEISLLNALDTSALDVAFQPIVGVNGHVIGAEALARWHHAPTNKNIPPSLFVPLAEATGLVGRLDLQVFAKAMDVVSNWRKAGCELDTVTVNMSVRTLERADIVERVRQELLRSGVPGSTVVIEITESFAAGNGRELSRTIHAINAYGVRFALDDFGTGSTSLRLLTELPISFLKIDKSFISDLGNPRKLAARNVVKATIDLAKTLGIAVIGEGVETPAEHAVLKELGCVIFQGFLFGRPQDGRTISSCLRDDHNSTAIRGESSAGTPPT